MKNALGTLPCFTQVESISKITSGLSQHCFKVHADNKIYFAKTINDTAEVSVAACASESGLSPNVIYHDQHWLITNYIDADNLALSTLSADDKVKYALKLMVQCHQLNVTPAELSAKGIIKSLLNNQHYPILQKKAFLTFADMICAPLNNSENGVCCHGDLNFSNVLLNQAQNTWLVDYECACIAPIEYDLAMFIAVNSLDNNDRTRIIEQYEIQSPVSVDPKLLNHCLLFCHFINTLWYFNAYHEKALVEETSEDKQILLKHAEAQWDALHSTLKNTDSPLLSSLSSKLTNVFTTLDFSNQT